MGVVKFLGNKSINHNVIIGDYIGGHEVKKSNPAEQVSIYKEALSLVERLHKQLLDVVKDELDRSGHEELTPVQALLLYNIGEDEWSAGELRAKGCYLGSNVSYNIKKLQDLQYVDSKKANHDKRQLKLKLTPKGQDIRMQLDAMFVRQANTVTPVGGIENDSLHTSNRTLARLERFWSDQVKFKM